jgi:hypothetical protein
MAPRARWAVSRAYGWRLGVCRGCLVERAHLVIHVSPLEDLQEHQLGGHTRCWCNPDVDPDPAGDLVRHNSLDGRELIEKHGVN